MDQSSRLWPVICGAMLLFTRSQSSDKSAPRHKNDRLAGNWFDFGPEFDDSPGSKSWRYNQPMGVSEGYLLDCFWDRDGCCLWSSRGEIRKESADADAYSASPVKCGISSCLLYAWIRKFKILALRLALTKTR